MPVPVPVRDEAAALLRDVVRQGQGTAQAARLGAGAGRRRERTGGSSSSSSSMFIYETTYYSFISSQFRLLI